MKIDPYYLRQKCRPMNLVSKNIRFMRIFVGIPLGKRHWGLSTTAIFGDLSGSELGVFTSESSEIGYKASNIIWRYATPCRPVTDCKMNDLE